MTDRAATAQAPNIGAYGTTAPSAALSQHSGIGALGPSASMSQYGGGSVAAGTQNNAMGFGGVNPLLNMSSTRSEINLNNLQVNNPLLTQGSSNHHQKVQGNASRGQPNNNKFEFNRTIF